MMGYRVTMYITKSGRWDKIFLTMDIWITFIVHAFLHELCTRMYAPLQLCINILFGNNECARGTIFFFFFFANRQSGWLADGRYFIMLTTEAGGCNKYVQVLMHLQYPTFFHDIMTSYSDVTHNLKEILSVTIVLSVLDPEPKDMHHCHLYHFSKICIMLVNQPIGSYQIQHLIPSPPQHSKINQNRVYID